MQQINDLDPKLQQFADRAVAEIVVPAFQLRAGTAPTTRAPRVLVVLVTVVAFALLASGAALATGLLSEVFRSGNVSAAGSRAVTLAAARVAPDPVPPPQQRHRRTSLYQHRSSSTAAGASSRCNSR